MPQVLGQATARILRTPKVCSCGRVHGIVVGGQLCDAGHFWFTCEACKSTMVEKSEAFEAMLAARQSA